MPSVFVGVVPGGYAVVKFLCSGGGGFGKEQLPDERFFLCFGQIAALNQVMICLYHQLVCGHVGFALSEKAAATGSGMRILYP